MALFDEAAINYDDHFTYSNIGIKVRQLVWSLLDNYIPPSKRDILEINCGTGTDAMHLASQGYQVTATDQSENMIEVARAKALNNNPVFEVLNFADISTAYKKNSFDLVFSNFGGLNCADPNTLRTVVKSSHDVLREGGLFIAVIMGSRCLWETGYYLVKGDTGRAFRRYRRSGAPTVIGSKSFVTYYYSPSDIASAAASQFETVYVNPVGIFLPPSYMEHYFSKHRSRLNILENWERRVNKMSLLANFADHYMIVMKKK